MVLLFNVYITEENISICKYDRGFANNFNKLDVFKYCLSSFANYFKWKRVIFNVKLDDYYKPREEELHNFIKKEFSHCDLLIRANRNEYQKDWQNDFEFINSNLIFYIANHDHAVIDSDPIYMQSILDEFEDNQELTAIQCTHFPEFLSFPYCKTNETTYRVDIHEKYLAYNIFHQQHSTMIINKTVYKHWFFDFDFHNILLPRTDYFKYGLVDIAPIKDNRWIVPYREIVRHFDGYMQAIWKFDNYACPVLEIPEGFFENNLKINYSPNIKQNFININPLDNDLRIIKSSGPDYNFSMKYIPYFWKDRISVLQNDFMELGYSENDLQNKFIERKLKTWDHISVNNKKRQDMIKERISFHYNNI
jgi:hypothetical protein